MRKSIYVRIKTASLSTIRKPKPTTVAPNARFVTNITVASATDAGERTATVPAARVVGTRQTIVSAANTVAVTSKSVNAIAVALTVPQRMRTTGVPTTPKPENVAIARKRYKVRRTINSFLATNEASWSSTGLTRTIL